MSAQVGLDELIRNLRETSNIGDEQLKNTTKNAVNFIVMLANNAESRRKPKLKATNKSKNTDLEPDNLGAKVGKEVPKPEPELEYADLEVIKKAPALELASEADRVREEEELGAPTVEEELTAPIVEEDLPRSTVEEEEFSQQKSAGETLYKSIRDKLRKLELCQGGMENMSNSY